MSRHYTKKDRKIQIEFKCSKRATVHGGQMAVNALAGEWGLWDRVRNDPRLDPRTHKHKGYDPVIYVAALLFGFTTGGDSLADVERLEDDETLKHLLGVKKLPDQSSVGEWMRNVGDEGAMALREIIRAFCEWVQKRCDPQRLSGDRELEWFFDDTQIEVGGHHFEGAKMNYNGDVALSWQTLWCGPLICDAVLGSPSEQKEAKKSEDAGNDVSAWLPEMLERTRSLRGEWNAHLFADSASSAGAYLECLEQKENRVAHYTVSYNKWVSALERQAGELAECAWSPLKTIRWRDGKEHQVQYARLRYRPSGCERDKVFSVVRHQLATGEFFWRYAFIAEDGHRELSPEWIFEKHHLKGDFERRFSELLSDLGLHHPPCQSLAANNVYYLIGVLAFDLLQALKLLYLPVDDQPKRVRTLLQHLLLMPIEIKRHARQLKAVCFIAAGWMEWWKGFLQDLVPHYQLVGG